MPGQEEVNHFLYFSSAEREDYRAEEMTKIKLARVNSTIFTTIAVLVSVLLYFNLDSSMLQCEGSLTSLIFTKMYGVQE